MIIIIILLAITTLMYLIIVGGNMSKSAREIKMEDEEQMRYLQNRGKESGENTRHL